MGGEGLKGGGWKKREESGVGLKATTRGVRGKVLFLLPLSQEQRTVSKKGSVLTVHDNGGILIQLHKKL